MTADQETERKNTTEEHEEVGEQKNESVVKQPCKKTRLKGIKLKLELNIPPMLPTFTNTPLSPPITIPLYSKLQTQPENMDLYIPNLSNLDMANNQFRIKPAGVPLIPFMPMAPIPGKLENGDMGMALPYSMMLPPIIAPQGDPLLPKRNNAQQTKLIWPTIFDDWINGKWTIDAANWNFMPKIKITNNKSKRGRGRKKTKTEVLMFNPNLFPTFGVPMKDEFGILGISDKRTAKKFPPKPLTNKEQRLRDTGSYVQVYRGTKKYTKGGLTKKDLVKNKKGRIVSRRQQSHNPLKKWVSACKQAKKELKIPGFCPLNKGPKGKELYKRAKEIYEEMKARDKKSKAMAATEAKAKAVEKLSPKVQTKNEQKITDLGSYSY